MGSLSGEDAATIRAMRAAADSLPDDDGALDGTGSGIRGGGGSSSRTSRGPVVSGKFGVFLPLCFSYRFNKISIGGAGVEFTVLLLSPSTSFPDSVVLLV